MLICKFDPIGELLFSRMSHPCEGLSDAIIEDMFGLKNEWKTQQGLALNISYKLLSMMNGTVRYVRDQAMSYFLVDIHLKSTTLSILSVEQQ